MVRLVVSHTFHSLALSSLAFGVCTDNNNHSRLLQVILKLFKEHQRFRTVDIHDKLLQEELQII